MKKRSDEAEREVWIYEGSKMDEGERGGTANKGKVDDEREEG